jgi:hypothetical protein
LEKIHSFKNIYLILKRKPILMKKNVKPAISAVALLMFVGAGTLFINESSAESATYKIGDRGPAGGWIFYDKGNSSDGWRYLEAAPEDQGNDVEWGCYGKSIVPSAEGTAIGTGKSNTQAIIKSCGGSSTAAKLAAEYRGGGKSDWFLPSKDELNLMYKNLHKNGIGGFAGYYWSSSEDFVNTVWHQGFNAGNQESDVKFHYTCRVRAVRAF